MKHIASLFSFLALVCALVLTTGSASASAVLPPSDLGYSPSAYVAHDLAAGVTQTYTVPNIPASTIDAAGIMTGAIAAVGMLFGLFGVFIGFMAARSLFGWALNTGKKLIKGR